VSFDQALSAISLIVSHSISFRVFFVFLSSRDNCVRYLSFFCLLFKLGSTACSFVFKFCNDSASVILPNASNLSFQAVFLSLAGSSEKSIQFLASSTVLL
jgi:hypothetical protein